MRDDGAPQRTLHCAACRIVQRSCAPRLSHSCRWLTKNNYGHRQVAVGLTAPIAVNGLSWNQWYRAPAFGEHRLLSAELVVSPKRACGRLHTFDESRRQWRSDDLRFIATVLRRRSGTNYIEYLSGNCDCLQGVCVRGFIEIGGVPAFDCPAGQLGKFDCGEGSPLVVGQPPIGRGRAAWADLHRAGSAGPSAPSLLLGAPIRRRREKRRRRQRPSARRGRGLRRPSAATAERCWCGQAARRILPSRIAARTTPGTLASSSRCAGSTTVMSTGTGRSRSSLSTLTEVS